MQEFESELEIFRVESESAIQFFYTWLSINIIASKDKSLLSKLNTTPLFWSTTAGALQASTLVTLARIFDNDKDTHNVSRLLNLAHRNMHIFSREALGERKKKISNANIDWLDSYLDEMYVPTTSDFRRLKGYVAQRRKVFEANYKPLRQQLYAHRNISASKSIGELFAKTNIRELQKFLVFLIRLYSAIWQLYFNGNKPSLMPVRYSVNNMLNFPSLSGHEKLPEKIIQQTRQLLLSIGEK